MQIHEVDKILEEKFPGKYRAVSYDRSVHTTGEIKIVCGVYVDGNKWHNAGTFQGALDSLLEVTEEPQQIEG